MMLELKALKNKSGKYLIVSGGSFMQWTPKLVPQCFIESDDCQGINMLTEFHKRYGGDILNFTVREANNVPLTPS